MPGRLLQRWSGGYSFPTLVVRCLRCRRKVRGLQIYLLVYDLPSRKIRRELTHFLLLGMPWWVVQRWWQYRCIVTPWLLGGMRPRWKSHVERGARVRFSVSLFFLRSLRLNLTIFFIFFSIFFWKMCALRRWEIFVEWTGRGLLRCTRELQVCTPCRHASGHFVKNFHLQFFFRHSECVQGWYESLVQYFCTLTNV